MSSHSIDIWILVEGFCEKKYYFLFLFIQISVHKITVEVELCQRPRRVSFTLLGLFYSENRVTVERVDIALELSNDTEIGFL